MTYYHLTLQDIAGISFSHRIGAPDEATSALGHIFVGFSWLERSIENHIAKLGQLTEPVSSIVCAELTFKAKVSVLSSLIKHQPPLMSFNIESELIESCWRDLLKIIHQAEEYRNMVAHSHWAPINDGSALIRSKITAKAKHGVRVVSESLSADYLLDIYDFILNVDYLLDEFFLAEPVIGRI